MQKVLSVLRTLGLLQPLTSASLLGGCFGWFGSEN